MKPLAAPDKSEMSKNGGIARALDAVVLAKVWIGALGALVPRTSFLMIRPHRHLHFGY